MWGRGRVARDDGCSDQDPSVPSTNTIVQLGRFEAILGAVVACAVVKLTKAYCTSTAAAGAKEVRDCNLHETRPSNPTLTEEQATGIARESIGR